MSNTKDCIQDVRDLLGYRLKRTQHILRLHMDEALRVLEITTPQYAVLSQLELRPGVSNAALARSSFMTAQTMHGIVSNLEKRKLIQRAVNPGHGRILCTKLTPKGLKIVQEAHHTIRMVEDRMTQTLNHQDKIRFQDILQECFNNLNQE